MLQYGYMDFGHKGYKLVSKNDFFNDNDRRSKLTELTNSASSEITYTGILTDLNRENEPSRYYIQATGPTGYRNGNYAHGYVQEGGECNFFGDDFLQLLRAKFYTADAFNDMSPDTATENFEDVIFPLVDDCIHPTLIDKNLLGEIVKQLLLKNRVLIRLDKSADDDGYYAYARGVLLTVYSCLPYAARKFCGFSVRRDATCIEEPTPGNTLPSPVKLVLIDGAAKLPDALPNCIACDMAGYREFRKDKNDDNHRFILFLTSEEEEHKSRENYFEAVKDILENSRAKKFPDFDDYRDVFLISEIVDQPVSSSSINEWALWYHRNQSFDKDKLRGEFINMLSARVSVDDITEHLRGSENEPDLMLRFPLPRKFSGEWLNLSGSETETSAADILALFNDIFSSNDKEKTAEYFAEHYMKEALDAVKPNFVKIGDSDIPTRAAIKSLEQLCPVGVPAKAGNELTRSLTKLLSGSMQQKLEELNKIHSLYLETELDDERRLVEDVKTDSFTALAQVYDGLMDESVFPLHCLDNKNSGGSIVLDAEIEQLIRRKAGMRPMPARPSDIEPFVMDWAEFGNSELARSGMLNEQLAVYRTAATAMEEYIRAKGGSVLSERFLSSLLALTENDRGSGLINYLARRLWYVDLAWDKDEVANFLHCENAWKKLASKLDALVNLCFKNGAKWTISAAEASDFLRWSQDSTKDVPGIVLQCAEKNPDLIIDEKISISHMEELYGRLPERSANKFASCMVKRKITRPFKESELARSMVSGLCKAGIAQDMLMSKADNSWQELISAVYSDPMLGPDGETLKRLNSEMQTLTESANRLKAIIGKWEETSDEEPMEIFVPVLVGLSLLPMILLWISGAASECVMLVILVAFAAEAAVIIALGAAAHHFGVDDGVLTGRNSVKLAIVSAAPGALLTLIVMLITPILK